MFDRQEVNLASKEMSLEKQLLDIQLVQMTRALDWTLRLGIDTKLKADVEHVFASYDPMFQVVGLKATHDVKEDYTDKFSESFRHVPGELLVEDDYDGTTNCGDGLHSSFGHDADSWLATLVSRKENGHRFHIVLMAADETVVVSRLKFKSAAQEVIFTGSLKDCHRLLQCMFGVGKTYAQVAL